MYCLNVVKNLIYKCLYLVKCCLYLSMNNELGTSHSDNSNELVAISNENL